MISTAVLVAPLRIDDLIDDGGPLFDLHYEEIRQGGDDAIDPAWSQYKGLERLDMLTCFGVRDVLTPDKPLVGYCVALFIERHLHYNRSSAQVDVMFVHPDYRHTSAAREMADKTRDAMRTKGASELTWHAVPGSRMHHILEKSERFQLRDYNYSENI